MDLETRISIAKMYLDDARWLHDNGRWNSSAPGLLEHLRLPLRKLYGARIRADYEAIQLDERTVQDALQTVEETIRVIEDTRG